MLNISQRTLRIYDKERILCPKRSEKNRRCYSLDDIEKAKLILFLTKNLALNLMGVKFVIALLEKEKVSIRNWSQYIEETIKQAKIDNQKLEENAKKTGRRGRKKFKNSHIA